MSKVRLNLPILELIEDLAVPAFPCIPRLMARELRRELIAHCARHRNS